MTRVVHDDEKRHSLTEILIMTSFQLSVEWKVKGNIIHTKLEHGNKLKKKQ